MSAGQKELRGAPPAGVCAASPAMRSAPRSFPAKRSASSCCAAERMVTLKARDFVTRPKRRASFLKTTVTSGGSSEREANELMVMP